MTSTTTRSTWSSPAGGSWIAATFFAVAMASATAGAADVHRLVVGPARTPETEGFKMGAATRPDGAQLTLDSASLRLNGRRWTPVMGEFHYSRTPESEWREELLKMKAGGVDILATYVFWIHHEELEGTFDWSAQRSLRRFVELAREVGLAVVVRCGPWCHGEVRNGGLPDWVLQKGWQVRTDDERYLAKVRLLYAQIAAQLSGLLWKEGGPVVGVQLDNEYSGPAQHLLSLKRLAREVGLDTPLYTRTGWPELATPMPFGEILPLYGNYAEGFWDRDITPMPDKYWEAFRFSNLRTNETIATDLLGQREAQLTQDALRYPYLACEIGGGMPPSYHRRIVSFPEDSESLVLVQIGSGSVLPGYYMYHGGTNPDGRLTTLQESQATAFWNDMPVKTYDYHAPLGEFGQVRPHYHLLRRLHLFLRDFGARLAGMDAYFPPQPTQKEDVTTLRWAVRSDGQSGFVFVNNYQRLQPMPAKSGVQFELELPAGALRWPTEPVTIPADSRFFWPFDFELAEGVRLIYATAQPLAQIDAADGRTVFFEKTAGVPAEFVFDAQTPRVEPLTGRLQRMADGLHVRDLRTGTGPALRVTGPKGATIQIVLLDTAQSLALYKATWMGRERAFLTSAGLVVDGSALRLTTEDPRALQLGIFPPPSGLTAGAARLTGQADGIFQRFTPMAPRVAAQTATFAPLKPAGPPRTIAFGTTSPAVAVAPEDADFAQAAVWRIQLPKGLDLTHDPILRLRYVGDVARVTLNGKLIEDNFYNGRELDLGLERFAPEILTGDLRIAVLPLRKDAPILIAKEAQPDFAGADSVARLDRVEIVERPTVSLGDIAQP